MTSADKKWLLELADKLSPGGHQVLLDGSVGRLWAARLRAIVEKEGDIDGRSATNSGTTCPE